MNKKHFEKEEVLCIICLKINEKTNEKDRS